MRVVSNGNDMLINCANISRKFHRSIGDDINLTAPQNTKWTEKPFLQANKLPGLIWNKTNKHMVEKLGVVTTESGLSVNCCPEPSLKDNSEFRSSKQQLSNIL